MADRVLAEEQRIAREISSRFQSRWLRGYSAGKIRRDPVYRRIWELTRGRQLPLLDVGCGIGLLAFYLRARGEDRRIVGTDFDGAKIAVAKAASSGVADVSFHHGDVREALNHKGDVALLDVLQYLPEEEQPGFLNSLGEMVAPGGMLVLRTTLRDASWRFRVSWAMEIFAGVIRWMRRDTLAFPSKEEVMAPFRSEKWQIHSEPLWERNPFNTHLFVFRRI